MAAEERESGREPTEGSGGEASGSGHPVGTGVGVVGELHEMCELYSME